MLSGIVTLAWRGRLGFIAQILTFASSLLPAAFGFENVLVFMLQVAAVVSVLIHSATLAIAIRLPPVSAEVEARGLAGEALTFLFAVALLPIPVGAGLEILGIGAHALWVCTAITGQMVCQGVYLISIAEGTRRANYPALMRSRLVYGVVLFVATLVACIASAPKAVFFTSLLIAYAAGTLSIIRSVGSVRNALAAIPPNLSLRHACKTVIRSRDLLIALSVGNLASQAGALNVSALGPLAGPWAVVLRVAGGFQTVGLQIAAPAIDIDISEGLRQADRRLGQIALHRALFAGGSLALFTIIASWFAIAVLSPWSGVGSTEWAAWWVALIGFAAATTFTVPFCRTLAMAGATRSQLAWDSLRALVSLAALVGLRDGEFLIALGFIGSAASASYVWLTRRALMSPKFISQKAGVR